jgi:hypothetical protein
MSECLTLLVDNLYADAAEAVKSRAALSASTPDLISIFLVILVQGQGFETGPKL